MIRTYLQYESIKKATNRISLWTGGLFCITFLLLMLLPACSITGFVGGTLNKPRAVTFGIAGSAGLKLLVEGEVGGEFIIAEKRWRSNYSLNLKTPPLLPGTTYPEEEEFKVGGYPIVGTGRLGDNLTMNVGLGIVGGVFKSEHVDETDYRGVRIDCRLFFVRDNEDIIRVYIGPEWGTILESIDFGPGGN